MRVRLLLVTFVLLAAVPAFAQSGYPSRADSQINDDADLLDTETTTALRWLLTDFRTQGVEMVVVTIGSVSDYDTGDETIESFATNLFNTWGIGDAGENDGILLLVAVDDREVRLEVGAGYDDAMNARMDDVLDENILPAFRDERYGDGIYNGVRAVIGTVTGTTPSSARNSAPIAPQPVRTPSRNNDTGFPFVAFCGLGIVLISAAWSFYRRYILMEDEGYVDDGSGSYGTDGGTSYRRSSFASSRRSSFSSSRPSSSSRSSGGGRSRGGGASGKW